MVPCEEWSTAPARRDSRKSYCFPLQCKRTFNPILTHQYAVEWPWPCDSSLLSTQGDVSSGNEPQESRSSTSSPSAGGLPHLSTPEVFGGVGMSSGASHNRTSHRSYEWPTFILDLSGDPFDGALDTNRASLLLSPGHRFYLPLIRLDEPLSLPNGDGVAYWKNAYRPKMGSSSATAPPCCAELVVGELSEIERVVRRQREMLTPQSARQSSTFGAPPVSETSRIPSPRIKRSKLPPVVYQHLFCTIPYKVLWLSECRDRLVVSLPCEERLAVLHCPLVVHHYGEVELPLQRKAAIHPFQLPRGVVPLDLATVYDRPFLAVGTYEDGVLICHLQHQIGVVDAVVRHISTSGFGSALFPITKVAPIFPPRRTTALSSAELGEKGAAAKRHQRAALVDSLCDGALLCSSPYDGTSTLIKLGGPPEGVMEDFGPIRSLDTVLYVSPWSDPDIGPLLCTASRKVQCLSISTASDVFSQAKKMEIGISDRASPCVMSERLFRGASGILRVSASLPVFQGEPNAKYVRRLSFTKHWLFCVDNRNQLLLLNRAVSSYALQSSIFLSKKVETDDGKAGRASTAPSQAVIKVDNDHFSAEASGGVAASLQSPLACKAEEESDAAARPRKQPKTQRVDASPKRKAGARPKDSTSMETTSNGDGVGDGALFTQTDIESLRLDDLCSGIITLHAQDECIQVAAAHDCNLISIVTWRKGSPSDAAH